MTKFSLLLSSAALVASAIPSVANAAVVFVGSWDVFSPNAPVWDGSPPNGPLAYTGQEAAALLFGGTASNYAISTIDNLTANINNKAWYDVIGFGQALRAENYSSKYLGQFYGPTNGYLGDPNLSAASAYVRDNLNGSGAINYAFRVTAAVPEPATWLMMILGFGLVGGAMRYRQRHPAKVTFG
jgi:hypothetical protein